MRVSRLYRHPVKGVSAVAVDALELDEVGPVGDRRWMVVTSGGERFLNQSTHPRMAVIEASTPSSGALVLRSPGRAPVEVSEPPGDADRISVPIWNDRADAVVAEGPVHGWLSDLLGEEVRLVRLPDDSARPVTSGEPPERFPGRVAFADDHPLHLVSEASVRDLDRRVPADAPRIEVERFRPNLVVEGVEAWGEDRWRRVRIGSVELAIVMPRARCVVTTLDPATGEKAAGPASGEPLATLRRFRRSGGKVWVGQNAVHDGPGVLRVGDSVELLELGDPRPDLSGAETNEGAGR